MGQKLALFVGKAAAVDENGVKDESHVFYASIMLHHDRDNIFGHSMFFASLGQLLNAIKAKKNSGEFDKVVFEPPKLEKPFRKRSLVWRYEALELPEIYRVQNVLEIYY